MANPDYDNLSGFPVNYDVGVAELDEAAPVTTFGVLAPLGTTEELAGVAGQGRNNALVENVGYGIQSVQPKPMDVETRYKLTSRIVEVNGNIAQGGNLHTLNNPSAVGGQGGTCFGDSGGPALVNNTTRSSPWSRSASAPHAMAPRRHPEQLRLHPAVPRRLRAACGIGPASPRARRGRLKRLHQ